EIQKANRLASAKSLKAGQQLVIPGGVKLGQHDETVLASAPARSYTVRNGDSLSQIADKHRVSVKDLQQWNKLGSTTDIRAGQKLVVASAPVAPVRQAEVVASAPRSKS